MAHSHEQRLQEQGAVDENRQAELRLVLESAQGELASAKDELDSAKHELESLQYELRQIQLECEQTKRKLSSSSAAHAAELVAVKQHHEQARASLQLKNDAAVQVGCCHWTAALLFLGPHLHGDETQAVNQRA